MQNNMLSCNKYQWHRHPLPLKMEVINILINRVWIWLYA